MAKKTRTFNVEFVIPEKMNCPNCGENITEMCNLEHAIFRLGECPGCEKEIAMLPAKKKGEH